MLARYYHRQHNEYVADLPFWQSLAGNQGDPVLELGCGTGRVVMALAQAGHQVWGLDHDLAMLAVLQERLKGREELNVQIVEADLTEFTFQQKFPLILLPCNTYSTLSPVERRRTLEAVRQHLPTGGVFAASLPAPARLGEIPEAGETEEEGFFIHPVSGNPVQVSSAWQRGAEWVEVSWHYDHLLPDGRVERLTRAVRHGLASAEKYLQEFEAAGFEVALYGDYERNAYRGESDILVIAATLTTA